MQGVYLGLTKSEYTNMSVYSDFLPQSTDMHLRLLGSSNFTPDLSVNYLSKVYPASCPVTAPQITYSFHTERPQPHLTWNQAAPLTDLGHLDLSPYPVIHSPSPNIFLIIILQ